MPSLDVTKRKTGEFIVYSLEGELIISTLFNLKKLFLEEFNEKSIYFAIDMSNATYVDSSGLGFMSNMQKKVELVNGHLVFFSVPEHILSIFKQAGSTEHFTIVKDEDEFKDNFII